LKRRKGAVNNPMLLVTIWGIAVFTLDKDSSILWWEGSGKREFGTGVTIISFVPLNSQSFGVCGDMFPKRFSNAGCEVDRDFGGRPRRVTS
jgi:hypothetical protein